MRVRAVLISVLILAAAMAGFAENKTALVIANGDYSYFSRLENPVPEARELSAVLKRLGFEVSLVTDASQAEMRDALYDFEGRIKDRGGIALLHYGGHAVQVDGRNYLIPADADIPDERRVRYQALDAGEILDTLIASGSDTNIVILDSCRNNPLPGGGRSGTRGLAVVGQKPKNSIIVYSAEAGTVARDGVFTPTLIKHLETPGMRFADVLLKTRLEVYEQTGGEQIPGSYEQLFQPIYLAGAGTAPARSPGFTVEPAYGSIKAAVAAAGTLYLDGDRQGALSPGASAVLTDVTVGEHTIELRYSDGETERKTVTVNKDRQSVVSFTYVERPKIPDGFVLVESGTFTMGSPESETNRFSDETQHTVTISRDFYMSKYEVTQAEYERVMGSNPSHSSIGIGDDYPVNQVSWYDAVEYCNKRSEREGLTPAYTINGNNVTWNQSAGGYRLPTEAEWEYAARGGQKAGSYNIYAGSDNISSVAWYGSNSGSKTHPVGGKQANELGLYDMSGNVWEWCWDRYDDYPTGSVTDPAGPSAGSGRVLRGGGWSYYAEYCRSADRPNGNPSGSLSSIGFRVVRAR